MKKYAVLNDENVVINIIVSSSKEEAESFTSSECVLITTETGPAWMNLAYSGGTFEQPPAPQTQP